LDDERGAGGETATLADNPLTISISRGIGRNVLEVNYALVRELVAEDLPRLTATPDSLRKGIPQVKVLRQGHHLIAKAIASGKSLAEVSAISGYSQSAISVLRNDPAFIELVALYADDLKKVYLDVHERMAAFSISTLEELQERFENNPETFTKRELLDMFTALADRAIPSAKGGPAPQAVQGGGGTLVQVNFVPSPTLAEGGVVIEAKVVDTAEGPADGP
jgi:hypothetical protein